MVAAAAEPVPAFYALRNVAAFRPGWWNGRPHTPADLAELADNFRRLSAGPAPLYVPFASVNHADPDRCGWVSGCRVGADGVLYLDVADVPADAARRVAEGRLAYPSIEYWDTRGDPRARLLSGFGFAAPGGGPPGLVLRCVTLLGSQANGAKGLPPLPAPARQPGRLGPPGAAAATHRFLDLAAGVRRFSAENFMDRTQILAAIKAACPGLSDATLGLLSDEQLQAMLADLQQAAAAGTPDPTPPAPPTQQQADMAGCGDDPARKTPSATAMYQDLAAKLANAGRLEEAAKRREVTAVVDAAQRAGKIMPRQRELFVKDGMAAGLSPLPPASAAFADACQKTRLPAPSAFDVWKADVDALPADPRFVRQFADEAGAREAAATADGAAAGPSARLARMLAGHPTTAAIRKQATASH